MDRRGFLKGLGALAAPTIVPIGALMPIRGIVMAPAYAGTIPIVTGFSMTDGYAWCRATVPDIPEAHHLVRATGPGQSQRAVTFMMKVLRKHHPFATPVLVLPRTGSPAAR